MKEKILKTIFHITLGVSEVSDTFLYSSLLSLS